MYIGNYVDLSSRAFISTNTTYQFHDNQKALYFNMNSKIAHHSALNHFSENSIGICDSGVDEILKHVVNARGMTKDDHEIQLVTKDIFIIGSGSGKWSKSDHSLNFHASQYSSHATSKKRLSDYIVLRKIEGTYFFLQMPKVEFISYHNMNNFHIFPFFRCACQ